MKSKISIVLFFALPFVIYGTNIPVRFKEEVKNIENLAKMGTEINEALLLKPDGFLGEGSYGFVYEGTIKEDHRPVAIKFVDYYHNTEYWEREMAMYSYLKAFKNSSVEIYGIPCIYYYGQWENYILIAFTKFDMNLEEVAEKVTSFGKNPLDILILLRDFVYQSKYLHSHGVRHDDIKPENIMLRGHQSFLIDLNGSSKMMEDNGISTPDYECRRNQCENRRAIDDYESFLYTISFITGKYWFKPWYDNKSLKDQLNVIDELEQIIKAFADEVFTNDTAKRFPNYNNLEEMISNQIKTIHPNGEPKFSWISTDAETRPARKITDIAEPKSIDFTKFLYPPMAVDLPQTSISMRERCSGLVLCCCSGCCFV